MRAPTRPFAPVTTTALRLVFTAWGAGEYGGSTGVAEIEVNGISLAASVEEGLALMRTQ